MKNSIYVLGLMLVAGCSTTTRVQVTPLGQEPEATTGKFVYALPESVIRIEATISETRHIPGPYWEYAERLLGIKELIRSGETRWQIEDVGVTRHTELDPGQIYTLNVLEGTFDRTVLDGLYREGLLVDGSEMVLESAPGYGLGAHTLKNYVRYEDLGVYGSFEERIETMYKTLVTDTSFVQVPVQRNIVEQKSPATRAQEAADFILDLRLRRFEMLTGEYEVFPQGEAMTAAIERLDRLEHSYLTLFTGKTFTTRHKQIWFVVPRSGSDPSVYRLGMFSGQLGFIPESLREGESLELRIDPLGKMNDLRSAFPQQPETRSFNRIYYRLPDVASLKVLLGDQILLEQRTSLFQSGALISAPLH
jgi:hypothetical protein